MSLKSKHKQLEEPKCKENDATEEELLVTPERFESFESHYREKVLADIHKAANAITSGKAKTMETVIQKGRDKRVCNEESKGQTQLHVINNSVTHSVSDQIVTWLVELRDIIAESLTEMHKTYITKLVFDPLHKSLIVVEDNVVIGGICFRMFPIQKFSEVVFVAVTTDKRHCGYGTHMMNHLKDYHIKHNIFILLTYADEKAVNFFGKMGFSTESTFKEEYVGYIKVYSGGQLMKCVLEPKIVYTEFTQQLEHYKNIIHELIGGFKRYTVLTEPTISTKPTKSTKHVKATKSTKCVKTTKSAKRSKSCK